jgi:hypothetical protein
MSPPGATRHFVTFPSSATLPNGAPFLETYYRSALEEFGAFLFGAALADVARLVDLATRSWVPFSLLQENRKLPLVCSLEIAPGEVGKVAEALARLGASGFGTDPAIDGFGHWCPAHGGGGTFQDSAAALEVSGISALHAKGWRGAGVNVVVVDKGFDPAAIPGSAYGDAWFRTESPGGGFGAATAPPPLPPDVAAHGGMIARLVHLAAPEARIWDMRAVVPWTGSTAFLADTLAAYVRAIGQIDAGTVGSPGGQDRWVFVNAWGMWDTRGEASAEPGTKRYSNDPTHPFTQAIAAAGARFDIVFAAGNCGALCPHSRCGPGDRGPGRSILGANGAAAVTSVGAARTDGIWLGYSAQGLSALGEQKVDLCAPSHFRRRDNPAEPYTGTSAASALAAGAIACLRSRGAGPTASPSVLRQRLRDAARKPAPGWDDRLGYGMIDVSAVVP